MPAPPGRELTDAVVELIAERMHSEGLSQSAVARATGMLQGTISDHLAGKGCLGPDRLRAYAEALGWESAAELLAAAERRA